MAFLKQVVVAILVVLLVGVVWLRFDPVPGRLLLAEDSVVPASLRPLVASISPADDEPPLAATPGRGGRGGGQAPLVVVDEARSDRTRQRLAAVGTGEAVRSVAVYPEASGIVTSAEFAPGDQVAAGDVLVRLQDDTERLALDRARIALQAANAQVERYEALSSASITAVQLDEVRRAAQNAQLDLRSAEIALERRQVLAPIAGHVGLSNIDVGALVGNQSLIATIDDRSRLKVVFNAPEGFVPEMSVGQPVSAVTTTRTGRTFEGEIAAMDSRLDEASRTLRTEAVIDNESDVLRPGMSFSLTLDFPGEDYLSVDALAIQWDRAGPFVWVVENDTARRAAIRIIERNIDRVLVASDEVSEGATVVREGVQSLRDGIAVRLQNEQPQPPAPVESEGVPAASAGPQRPADRTGSMIVNRAAAAEVAQ